MSTVGTGREGDEGLPAAELERELSVGRKLDELERRAVWLDEEFRVPYTDLRVGVSTIVGLLPGAGDGAMMLLAATIVYHGVRLGAPTRTLLLMTAVLLVEGVVSVVPVVGDAVGMLWPANLQNVGYLRANEATLDGAANWWFPLLLLSPSLLTLLALAVAL